MKKKLTYVEPNGYISPEMKKILKKEDEKTKTSSKKTNDSKKKKGK